MGKDRQKNIKSRGSSQNMETYRDIMDGKLYQEICNQFEKSGLDWLSCIFNTDGVALYKFSKIDIWPIYIAINKIPAQERFLCKNIILLGLWRRRGKPSAHTFMKAFVDEMNCRYKYNI